MSIHMQKEIQCEIHRYIEVYIALPLKERVLRLSNIYFKVLGREIFYPMTNGWRTIK